MKNIVLIKNRETTLIQIIGVILIFLSPSIKAITSTVTLNGNQATFSCAPLTTGTASCSTVTIQCGLFTNSTGNGVLYSNEIISKQGPTASGAGNNMAVYNGGGSYKTTVNTATLDKKICSGPIGTFTGCYDGTEYVADNYICIDSVPAISCTATEVVIDHGDIAPNTYSGNKAQSSSIITCNADSAVSLSFSPSKINLSNGTESNLTFVDTNSDTETFDAKENVAQKILIQSTLAGTPTIGAFNGTTTLVVSPQ